MPLGAAFRPSWATQKPAARVAKGGTGVQTMRASGRSEAKLLGDLGEGQVALAVVGDDVDEHRGLHQISGLPPVTATVAPAM